MPKKNLKDEALVLAKYLDIVRHIILILDDQGKITFLNKIGHKILGYKDGELMGKNWIQSCIPPADRNAVKAVHDNNMKGKELIEKRENDILTKSGDIRRISWNNTVIRDSEGQIIGSLSSGEDITDMRNALDLLRESEEKFRAIVDQSSEMLFLHEMDGRIADVNLKVLYTYGYSKEEIVKLKVADIDPDYKKRVEGGEFWKRFEEKRSFAFEGVHRKKGGVTFPVEITLTKIKVSGKPYIMALARDISERRKSEEEIAKRIEELEIFNRLTVDRELKMMEMKKVMKALEDEIQLLKGRNKPKLQ